MSPLSEKLRHTKHWTGALSQCHRRSSTAPVLFLFKFSLHLFHLTFDIRCLLNEMSRMRLPTSRSSRVSRIGEWALPRPSEISCITASTTPVRVEKGDNNTVIINNAITTARFTRITTNVVRRALLRTNRSQKHERPRNVCSFVVDVVPYRPLLTRT